MAREKRKDDPITEQDDRCSGCTKGYAVHHCFKCGAGFCGGCVRLVPGLVVEVVICDTCATLVTIA